MSHHDNTTTWRLGPELERQRTERGIATRAAARLAGISDTLWRSLERGYEVRRGRRDPINPRPATVVNAARAVGLNPREALELAGLDPAVLDQEPPASNPALVAASNDDLLSELRRRLDAQRPPNISDADVDAEPDRYARPDDAPPLPHSPQASTGR